MNKPPKPPRIPKGRDDLWRVLRIMPRVCIRDLAAITDRPAASIRREMLRLSRTGYAVLHNANGARSKRKWALVRNTGPNPPLFMLDGTTLIGAVDRNTRETYGVDGGKPPVIGRRGRHPWLPKIRTALSPEVPV
jgi:hypothetical protein